MNLTDALFSLVKKPSSLTDALFYKKIMGDGGGGELPDGYRKVKGFEMNNDCYFKITDFYLTGADTLKFSFSMTATCNVIGSYSGSATGNNYSLYATTSSTGKYLRYKSGAYNSYADTDKVYNVVISPTGTQGMETNSTWSQLDFTCTEEFYVGTTSPSSSSAKLKGSLYGNIEVVGRLKLIPCERLEDNVLGYYDAIGETFYAPAVGTPTVIE